MSRPDPLFKDLQPGRVVAREDAVVQGFVTDSLPVQLPLEVFMAVDAQLGSVGKVGAKLEEEGTEILVDTIKATSRLTAGFCSSVDLG